MKKPVMLLFVAVLIVVSGCSAVTQQIPAPLPAQTSAETQVGESVSLRDLEQEFVGVYERVNPSVVNIRVTLKQGAGGLPEFNFDIPGFPQIPTPDIPGIPQGGQGSGFVYDTDGHIVTNNHVVDGADRIVVTFADGTEAEAELVGADPNADLAVIKVDVDAALLKPAALADSDALKVGQIVIAIGNPFGLQGSMTTGIVSGLERDLRAEASTSSGASYTIPDIVQTDAAINPGNSGGPLLNLKGEVIGVNTAIESPVRASAGVGYAVPVNIVKRIVPELIADGKVEYPRLGISGQTLLPDLAKAMGLNEDQRGVLVIEAVDGGPAEKAGLKSSQEQATIDGQTVQVGGDVIVGIDDQAVEKFDDLLGYIVQKAKVGQTVTLRILRGGETQDIEVTLGERPE